jgi:Zn-finger nucleic acid-binding protein
MNCPGCGAPLEPAGDLNSSPCPQCVGTPAPEDDSDGVRVVGEPVGALCPLCRVPLASALAEGETVCYCDSCRGFLAETDTFGIIVIRRRARRGPGANRTDPFDPAELKRALACPNCHERMETHPYYGGGNAVVDTCEGCCLIWLDAGELAVIGSYTPHDHRIEPTLTLPGARSDWGD